MPVLSKVTNPCISGVHTAVSFLNGHLHNGAVIFEVTAQIMLLVEAPNVEIFCVKLYNTVIIVNVTDGTVDQHNRKK